MRRYESVWVVNGDLPDEEIKGTIDKFSKIISTQGGTLVRLEEWGRKKLSYRIQGVTRGYYVVVDYAGTPATVKELERNYRIDDRLIRSHTAKKSEKVNMEALQEEIAAGVQAAAAAAPAPETEPEEAAPEAAAAVEAVAAPVSEVEAEAAPQGQED
ncbi:MAG: 30S ribosomal protein S6 [Desulfobaccales bacterium]|jgi:small subunit ribosomal protein S6